MTALWLSISATGWLARYLAAAGCGEAITFDNVAGAIGIVDRAATRLPALGSSAERARLAYLTEDNGIFKLLQIYRLVEE